MPVAVWSAPDRAFVHGYGAFLDHAADPAADGRWSVVPEGMAPEVLRASEAASALKPGARAATRCFRGSREGFRMGVPRRRSWFRSTSAGCSSRARCPRPAIDHGLPP